MVEGSSHDSSREIDESHSARYRSTRHDFISRGGDPTPTLIRLTESRPTIWYKTDRAETIDLVKLKTIRGKRDRQRERKRVDSSVLCDERTVKRSIAYRQQCRLCKPQSTITLRIHNESWLIDMGIHKRARKRKEEEKKEEKEEGSPSVVKTSYVCHAHWPPHLLHKLKVK